MVLQICELFGFKDCWIEANRGFKGGVGLPECFEVVEFSDSSSSILKIGILFYYLCYKEDELYSLFRALKKETACMLLGLFLEHLLTTFIFQRLVFLPLYLHILFPDTTYSCSHSYSTCVPII